MPTPRNTLPGIAAMILGFGAAVFGAFGLVIVTLQRLMFSAFAPHDPGAETFLQIARPMWSLFSLHLPIWIVVGCVLGWHGNRLRTRRPGVARAVAILALAAFGELVCYSIDILRTVVPAFERTAVPFPFPFPIHAWMTFSVGSGLVILGAPILALAAFAWRARERSGTA